MIRPLPPDEYDSLRCPACDYDVRQTLIDGFDVCPECGEGIKIRSCKPRAWDDSPWSVAFLFLVFFFPSIALLTALVLSNFSFLALIPGWTLGVGALGSAFAVVFVGLRYAQERMGERPSVLRSFVAAACVIGLNIGLLSILGGALPFLLLF